MDNVASDGDSDVVGLDEIMTKTLIRIILIQNLFTHIHLYY